MTDRQPPTPDDAGAPVIDADGTQVGTLANVDGDAVTVRPESEVNDDALARASLGWGDTGETYSVDPGALERIDSPSGPSFQMDLGEYRGGVADEDVVATGGPEPRDTDRSPSDFSE